MFQPLIAIGCHVDTVLLLTNFRARLAGRPPRPRSQPSPPPIFFLGAIEGLESLRHIGGRLGIHANASLYAWPHFSSLVSAGDLPVRQNGSLTTVAMPALESLGALSVTDNLALASPDMPALAATNRADMENNPVLPTCAVHALLDQAGTSWRTVAGNDDSATCAAP